MATDAAIRKLNKLSRRIAVLETRVALGIVQAADRGLQQGTESIKQRVSYRTGSLIEGIEWERFKLSEEKVNTITGKFISEQNYYFPHAKYKGIDTKKVLIEPIRREVKDYIASLNIRRLLGL